MKFGCCFLFALTFLTNFSAAFHQYDNQSKAETLVVNANKYSLLSDSNQIRDSPGKQEGNDVGFVKEGPLNLTLYDELKFEINFEEGKRSCKTAHFGICYDAHSPDNAFIGSCSPSQCYLKISMDEENNVEKSNTNWAPNPNLNADYASFSFSGSSSSMCKPKIENGMIQLNVKSIGCPVKAKDAQIKYPEVPSTTLDPSHKAAGDSLNQASFWNEGGWIILVVVLCLLACILLVGGAVSLFYCLKMKKNSVKAPPPPSIIAADKKSIAMGQQPSVVMPNAEVVQKKKKKNDGKKKVNVDAATEKSAVKKNTQKIAAAAAAADVPKKRSSESVEDEFICRTDEWLPESALEELKKSRA